MKFERFLSQDDATILSRLAENLLRQDDASVDIGEQLIDIISTSILLPENDPRSDFVALNSNVAYRFAGSNELHHICIVMPGDANEGIACASVLAPLSLALFGRQIGSTVEVTLPFNRIQHVEVVDVKPTLIENPELAQVPGTV